MQELQAVVDQAQNDQNQTKKQKNDAFAKGFMALINRKQKQIEADNEKN